jgi:hypothetical protein
VRAGEFTADGVTREITDYHGIVARATLDEIRLS